MKTLFLNNHLFEEILNTELINQRIKFLAKEIDRDYENLNPIFLPVLNGSFIFAANLIQSISISCEVSFLKLKSYQDMYSTGKISELMGLDTNICERHIIIVEDIVESGLTTKYIIDKIKTSNPASIKIATLLHKPHKLEYFDSPLKYIGFNIKNEFVVGYGLDYNGIGRNIGSIYQLIN